MNKERPKFVTFDGLDATGKTTLIKIMRSKIDSIAIQSFPTWMKPVREKFDDREIEIRFLYYAFGNLWADRFLLRPLINNSSEAKVILQDRSWLTTLSSHELRGLSRGWLHMGLKMAKSSVKPDISFILHVDPEVRRERLENRGLITKTDLQNLQYENEMENGYFSWAGRLEWTPSLFDNTERNPIEACDALINYITKDSKE